MSSFSSQLLRIEEEVRSVLDDPVRYQSRLRELLNDMYPQLVDLTSDVTNSDSIADAATLATIGLSELAADWLSGNPLTNDNAQDFVDAFGTSQAATLAAAEIRDELCTDKSNEYLIIFDDPTLGAMALDQLCNLTFTQFEQLINDIYLDSADATLILGQVSNNSRHFKNRIKFKILTQSKSNQFLLKLLKFIF